jgi:macrolide-specific efflux system membrane fusion protein
MVRKLLYILIISMVILSGCKSKDEDIPILTEAVGTELMTAVVSRGDIYNLATYDAKIYPDIQELYSIIDGNVGEIPVYLGQEVKEGQVLLKFDDEGMKDELSRLEKQLEETKKNNKYVNIQANLDIEISKLNLAKKIADQATTIEITQTMANIEKQELLQKQALELQEFSIKNIEEKIEELKTKLSNSTIKAPYDGSIVYIKNLRLNERISAYDTIFIITNHSKAHLQTSFISESEIRNASEVYATIKGKDYEIEYVPLTTDETILMKNGGVTIESKFILNEEISYEIGTYACINVKEKLVKDVKYLPKNALYSDASGDFVYLIIDGNLVRKSVETGTVTDINVEIISGLEEGDEVYVKGI